MRIIAKLIIVSLIFQGGCLFGEVAFAGNTESVPMNQVGITDFGEPVSSDILDSLSGGQNLQIDTIDMLVNNMNLRSEVGKNILFSTSTGANVVSGEAFANASGISTVIQNSGNQVIINSALILNLRVQ